MKEKREEILEKMEELVMGKPEYFAEFFIPQ